MDIYNWMITRHTEMDIHVTHMYVKLNDNTSDRDGYVQYNWIITLKTGMEMYNRGRWIYPLLDKRWKRLFKTKAHCQTSSNAMPCYLYSGESSVTKIIRNGHQGKLKRSQQLNDHNFALIPPWHWQQWCWICFCQQCVLWGHCWFCDWPNINENLLKLCFTKNSCKGRTVLFGLLIKDRFLLLVQYWQESASSTSVFLKSFQLLYLKALNPYYLVSKTCQTEDS